MSRLSSEEKRQQKTEARVGLASNIVGLAAGTAALGTGLRDERLKDGGRVSRALYRTGQRIPSPIGRRIDKMPMPKRARVAAGLAAGGVALQAANLGGDVVANRVLQRSADVKKEFNMDRANDQGISKAYVSPQVRTTGHGTNIAKADKKQQNVGLAMTGTGLAGAAGGAYVAANNSKFLRRSNRQMLDYSAGIRDLMREEERLGNASRGVRGGFVVNSRGVAVERDALGEKKRLLENKAAVEDARRKLDLKGLALGEKRSAARKLLSRGRLAMGAGGVLAATGAGLTAYGRRSDVKKAYRRFDPEADRQRRLGTYAGIGGGTAIALSVPAAQKLKRAGIKISDMKAGKKGALLALGALAAGGAGAASYRRGVQVRNQPWT